MAELIRRIGLPNDFKIIATSCWHVGSKGFHRKAARHIVNKLKKDNVFGIFLGDAVEGKPIGGKHFSPHSLEPHLITAGDQFEEFGDIIAPVAKKFLCYVRGNHDIYCKDSDPYGMILKNLGVKKYYGGYQTWLHLGKDLRLHCYHGKRSMPRGAKDPIQKKGNQHAWMVNYLHPLAGDCHAHLTGHIHHLMIQEPIGFTTLFTDDIGAHRETFVMPPQTFTNRKGRKCLYVPPTSRWYAACGTIRRGGGFGYEDYAEVAGYPPPPIGYVEIKIRDKKIADMKEVIL